MINIMSDANIGPIESSEKLFHQGTNISTCCKLFKMYLADICLPASANGCFLFNFLD
jgi:hypothetical protein